MSTWPESSAKCAKDARLASQLYEVSRRRGSRARATAVCKGFGYGEVAGRWKEGQQDAHDEWQREAPTIYVGSRRTWATVMHATRTGHNMRLSMDPLQEQRFCGPLCGKCTPYICIRTS